MDGQLDSHCINYYESKNRETRFVRVDNDVVDKLIQKDDAVSIALTDHEQEILRPVFESQMPATRRSCIRSTSRVCRQATHR